jgi:hypothetical protein
VSLPNRASSNHRYNLLVLDKEQTPDKKKKKKKKNTQKPLPQDPVHVWDESDFQLMR